MSAAPLKIRRTVSQAFRYDIAVKASKAAQVAARHAANSMETMNVLQLIINFNIPPKVILSIFEYVVLKKCLAIGVKPGFSVEQAAIHMLGDSIEAHQLRVHMEQAFLNAARWSFEIPGSSAGAIMVTPHVRHISIRILDLMTGHLPTPDLLHMGRLNDGYATLLKHLLPNLRSMAICVSWQEWRSLIGQYVRVETMQAQALRVEALRIHHVLKNLVSQTPCKSVCLKLILDDHYNRSAKRVLLLQSPCPSDEDIVVNSRLCRT